MLLIEQVILSQVFQVVSVLWLQDKLGGCLSGCLVQLLSNNNKKKTPSLQLVCNQGNHSVVKTTNLFLQYRHTSYR